MSKGGRLGAGLSGAALRAEEEGRHRVVKVELGSFQKVPGMGSRAAMVGQGARAGLEPCIFVSYLVRIFFADGGTPLRQW